MSAPTAPAAPRPLRPVSLALLLVSVVLLGYLSGLPYLLGSLLGAMAVVFAVGLRRIPSGTAAAYAPVPVLLALSVEAVIAPVGLGSELVAGLAGLSFLLWLADDPARPAGGAVRGLPSIAIPALAVGIAWSSALFLRSGSVPLGVAGALLALALAAVAFLAGRPAVFDREGT